MRSKALKSKSKLQVQNPFQIQTPLQIQPQPVQNRLPSLPKCRSASFLTTRRRCARRTLTQFANATMLFILKKFKTFQFPNFKISKIPNLLTNNSGLLLGVGDRCTVTRAISFLIRKFVAFRRRKAQFFFPNRFFQSLKPKIRRIFANFRQKLAYLSKKSILHKKSVNHSTSKSENPKILSSFSPKSQISKFRLTSQIIKSSFVNSFDRKSKILLPQSTTKR